MSDRDDQVAYTAVKALKAIVQNAQTKEQAQEALDAIRTGSTIKQIMQNIVGYDELPNERLPAAS